MVPYKMVSVFCKENIERVREIVNAKYDPMELSKISPSFIVMDLTWRCNYKCPGCIDEKAVNSKIRSNNKGTNCSIPELPEPIIADIFDYAGKNKVRGIMTMGGEVFLYKKGIETALKKSIENQVPVKTVTNGSILGNYVDLIKKAYQIPGSQLRVSINADREHYEQQTGQKGKGIGLNLVLENIQKITTTTPVTVSTVIFPESSAKHGLVPNVEYLREIIKYCEDVGVTTQILLPARDSKSNKRYCLSEKEQEIITTIEQEKQEFNLNLETESFSQERRRKRARNQNLNFWACPSGFIFTLLGSDRKIYKCTDNRGNPKMVLGQIHEPGDFERFWHSPGRVVNQCNTPCPNKGCGRYTVNVALESLCKAKSERDEDLTDYFEEAIQAHLESIEDSVERVPIFN